LIRVQVPQRQILVIEASVSAALALGLAAMSAAVAMIMTSA